jgi:hypothetical protein
LVYQTALVEVAEVLIPESRRVVGSPGTAVEAELVPGLGSLEQVRISASSDLPNLEQVGLVGALAQVAVLIVPVA